MILVIFERGRGGGGIIGGGGRFTFYAIEVGSLLKYKMTEGGLIFVYHKER